VPEIAYRAVAARWEGERWTGRWGRLDQAMAQAERWAAKHAADLMLLAIESSELTQPTQHLDLREELLDHREAAS
jgi:hypothetical protein